MYLIDEYSEGKDNWLRRMADDEFNVVGTYGDDDPMTYPEDDIGESSALTSLNDVSGRGSKRLRRELDNAPQDDIYVHPIDWHMRMPCSLEETTAKRMRMENDEALISSVTRRILEARMRRSNVRSIPVTSNEEVDDDCLIMENPPIDGSAWMGVTCDEEGDRRYFRLRRRKGRKETNRIYTESRENAFSALAMHTLIEEATQLREQRAKKREEESRREENWEERQVEVEEEEGDKEGGELWVNKYAPRKYVDLLSPDVVNRQVMKWLRLWDECVFGRKETSDKLQNTNEEKEVELFGLDDGKPRRPLHRILLISGPAGLGKTTLASVCARLAGYSVVETNASDQRNVGDMERVVEGAMRTARTLDKDNRPICLVLDEIDGATVDTIRWLVKTLSAGDRKKIRRPIIAICNNLYTPALRELRTVALNVTVNPTKASRMIERLREIADAEKVRVDTAALETLTRLCTADIRLALNVLQYVSTAANKQGRIVGVSEVEKAVEKSRPPEASVFVQWSIVLEFTRHHDSKGIVVPVRDRLKTVERMAMGEEVDRLVTGLHHNYTSIATLTATVLSKASSVFSTLDLFSHVVFSTKNYSLYRYITPSFLMLHLVIATHAKAQLQFPSHVQTMQLRHKQSQETVDTVRSHLSSHTPPSQLVLETLPLLVVLLQPPIKTANLSLMSHQEQRNVRRVVEGLRSYGLTFQPVTVEGGVQYTFAPPVDILTMFSISTPHRNPLSNNVRKMLAHEVLLASVRQSGSKENSSNPSKGASSAHFNPSSSSCSNSFVPLHFKYHNHFSNAVKRNVRITQLIM